MTANRVLILLLLAVSGCADSTPSLIIRPADRGRPFIVNFTRAFWSPDEAGEDRIVLLNDPVDKTLVASGDPLPAQSIPPIRQLLVIHLQWRYAISTRTDTPASSNAVLNYYVYGGGYAGVIHYTGSAHVSVSPSKSNASIEIRNGSLKLTDKTGPLQDPFGSFSVDGKVTAVNSPVQLEQVMADLSAVNVASKEP